MGSASNDTGTGPGRGRRAADGLRRATEVDFTPALIGLELGLLVPAGSALSTVEAMDQTGLRIGVSQGSSSQATRPSPLLGFEGQRLGNKVHQHRDPVRHIAVARQHGIDAQGLGGEASQHRHHAAIV